MLPVIAMSVLATSEVMSRRATAAHARSAARGVSELTDTVRLLDALHAQAAAEAFDARFVLVDTKRAHATDFLGFNWAADVPGAQRSADDAIRALGPRSPVAVGVLSRIVADIKGDKVSAWSAARRFEPLLAATARAVGRTADRLEREGRAPSLVARLESLRTVATIDAVTAPQVVDLSAVWFPMPTDSPDDTRSALLRFATETADYASGSARLRVLGVPGVVASLDRMGTDAQVRAYDHFVNDTVQGKSISERTARLDAAQVAATFRGYRVRYGLLDGVVQAATKAVHDDARRVAAAGEAGFERGAFGAVALALASIGVALALARSTAKPLRDLFDYAHAVNEGQIDAPPMARRDRGPRETRLVHDVFTDLVANLRLLDAKANALAHCDFDDPVLHEPLPGRLGQSLESSVAVLSGSIVERDQLQSHLAYQATHDSLTGVYNRPAAISAIEATMRRSQRSGAATALLYIDLNEFKAVNDSHGHEVGDQVLCEVATRLSADLRGGDFVARLGGDEFVVLAEAVGGIADATDLARRVLDAVSTPMIFGALRVTIGAAIGIALNLDGPEDALRLLARADAAMYRAKHHDHSAIEIFDADLQRAMLEREDVEAALAEALAQPDGGGLRLDYQPVVDAATGALVSLEALVRWNRPGHGLLRPDAFIPIAEATSLIIDLDCWVLGQATRQLARWSDVPEFAAVPVAVNVSGRHLLSRRLAGHIRAALAEAGVEPRRLGVEITETVLLADLAVAASELVDVRALGVSVSIDDFGTGYTSLAHLQLLPIDTIKIDRSFVSQVNAQRGGSLVRMVTDLGHAIDVVVIAEGVETPAELTALRAMGTDLLQGFLLSAPLEPAALLAWARAQCEMVPAAVSVAP